MALAIDQRGQVLRPVDGRQPRRDRLAASGVRGLDRAVRLPAARCRLSRRRSAPARNAKACRCPIAALRVLPRSATRRCCRSCWRRRGRITGWSAVLARDLRLPRGSRPLASGSGDADTDVGVAPMRPLAYVDAIVTAARTALNGGAKVVVVAPTYSDGRRRSSTTSSCRRRCYGARRETGRIRFVDLGDEPGMVRPGLAARRRQLRAPAATPPRPSLSARRFSTAPRTVTIDERAGYDKTKGPANPERSFGISVGGVLCVIAAVPVVARPHRPRRNRRRHRRRSCWSSARFTRRCSSSRARSWWRFARALGYVNARILLTIVVLPRADCRSACSGG